MLDVIRLLNDPDIDDFTKFEVRRFADSKCEEYHKFSGQIARDLRRIGEYAFQQSSAYSKLREKYKRAHAGRKKLLILDNMQRKWAIDD